MSRHQGPMVSEQMAAAEGLGSEIGLVMVIAGHDMGNSLDHLDTTSSQLGHFIRVVGHQTYPVEAEPTQHFSCREIEALVGIEPKPLIGVQRVVALILELIGPQFVDETDAAPFLSEVQDDTVARGRNLGDGPAQLLAAVAPQRAQQVAGKAFRVQPDQDRLAGLGLADDDGEMLVAAVTGPEGNDPRVGRVSQRNPCFGYRMERLGGLPLIGRDLCVGNQPQVMMLAPSRIGVAVGGDDGHRGGWQ